MEAGLTRAVQLHVLASRAGMLQQIPVAVSSTRERCPCCFIAGCQRVPGAQGVGAGCPWALVPPPPPPGMQLWPHEIQLQREGRAPWSPYRSQEPHGRKVYRVGGNGRCSPCPVHLLLMILELLPLETRQVLAFVLKTTNFKNQNLGVFFHCDAERQLRSKQQGGLVPLHGHPNGMC